MVGSSDFLQRHHDEILAAWANEAGRAASARGLSDTELRNLMPACLSALTGDADFAELMRHIQRHISDRIRWGFEIAEAVDEFAMLDRCIADRVRASPPDERPPADELARLFLTVQSIMVRTAETYEKHMRLDEQREKWFLRQLRTLADEALRATERPLAQPLKQMLAVIMEAMSAQCAALFLYDLRTELLVTRAAIGVAEEHLQEFTSSLDPATFAGRIAAHEEPTAVDDVATTELVVSDALRRSGIHSLLGVRLPPLHRIRGVMYVGIHERRSFSSRESRRIEALGEGLTLHLDNGRLHAELRERIGELEVERGLRERFVAILAHDLRGPLTSAKMSASLLNKLGGRAAQRPEITARIERNLERVDHMIRDLLDVSRMHAGQSISLHLDWCDLREVAEEVAEDLRAVHGPRFEVVAEDDVRGVWSRDELRRALWNLCTNAVKYGRADTPVTVRLVRKKNSVRLSIHNFGDPIPAEAREGIFDLFSRPRPTPQVGDSWGLGLAFVRACAEAHGGTIEVESALEVGTTFTMTLPLDARPSPSSGR